MPTNKGNESLANAIWIIFIICLLFALVANKILGEPEKPITYEMMRHSGNAANLAVENAEIDMRRHGVELTEEQVKSISDAAFMEDMRRQRQQY